MIVYVYIYINEYICNIFVRIFMLCNGKLTEVEAVPQISIHRKTKTKNGFP